MGKTARARRTTKLGFILLSTLLSLLILASLVIALQQKAFANVRIMAKITNQLQDAAAKSAVYERLRGPVADAMTGISGDRPRLNGEAIILSEAGRDWTVRVQDVEGLIDVYFSPPQTLALLPIDAARVAEARERELSQLQPGERFPTLAASLARFGVPVGDLDGMVTQASQTGSLRVATLALALRALGVNIPPGVREAEQVIRVTIDIRKV